jgi:hypothetical protein
LKNVRKIFSGTEKARFQEEIPSGKSFLWTIKKAAAKNLQQPLVF